MRWRRCRDYEVCCTRTMRASYRDRQRAGVDDYGDRDLVSFTINAAGQVYKQEIEFVYLDGAITAERDLRIEITQRL